MIDFFTIQWPFCDIATLVTQEEPSTITGNIHSGSLIAIERLLIAMHESV